MIFINDLRLGSGDEGKRPFLGAGDTTTGGARVTGSGYAVAAVARVAQAIASGGASVLGGGYTVLAALVQSRFKNQQTQ